MTYMPPASTYQSFSGFRLFDVRRLWLMPLLFLLNCSTQKYVVQDTTYSIQTAYAKLQPKYPQITPATVIATKEVKAHYNLAYAKLSKERTLFADVFHPVTKAKANFPTILMIHGGGWLAGTKENLTPLAQSLALRGFTTVVIEYRLGKGALYPAAVNDVRTALRWLRSESQRYHIDSNQIAVLGCSAGAQLATLIGTTDEQNIFPGADLYQDYSSRVQAIVNIDGIVSFVHPEAEPEWTGKSANAWLGSYAEQQERWREASPLEYVNSATPPTLFINSSVPRFHAGRDDYIQQLTRHNTYSQVHEFEDCPHSFWLFSPWFAPTTDLTADFLQKVFYP